MCLLAASKKGLFIMVNINPQFTYSQLAGVQTSTLKNAVTVENPTLGNGGVPIEGVKVGGTIAKPVTDEPKIELTALVGSKDQVDKGKIGDFYVYEQNGKYIMYCWNATTNSTIEYFIDKDEYDAHQSLTGTGLEQVFWVGNK